MNIQIKRGSKSKLDSVMSGPNPLPAGSLGFTMDTEEVYISDGTNVHLVGKAMFGEWDSRPSAGVKGRIYVSTDYNKGVYLDTGSSWELIATKFNSLDSIPNGTIYGRVRNSYLDSGRPDGLYYNGNKISSTEIVDHFEEHDIHRRLDDNNTSSTRLWSSNKIDSFVQQKIAEIPPVKDNFYVEHDSYSSNSSTDWQTRLTLPTNNLTGGIYKLTWSYEWRTTYTSSYNALFRVMEDNSTWRSYVNSHSQNSSAYYQASGFSIFAKNVWTNPTFTLEFRNAASGRTVYTRRTRMHFYKIA